MGLENGAVQQLNGPQILRSLALQLSGMPKSPVSLDSSDHEELILNLLHEDIASVIQALGVESYPQPSRPYFVLRRDKEFGNSGPILVAGRLQYSKHQVQFLFRDSDQMARVVGVGIPFAVVTLSCSSNIVEVTGVEEYELSFLLNDGEGRFETILINPEEDHCWNLRTMNPDLSIDGMA